MGHLARGPGAGLGHRITRLTPTYPYCYEETEMASMLENAGAEYVTNWPANIASRFSLSAEYVIDALNTVTGSALTARAAYSTKPLTEVAALDSETAQAVIAEVREIAARLAEAAHGTCHTCGLPLRGGACTECV